MFLIEVNFYKEFVDYFCVFKVVVFFGGYSCEEVNVKLVEN